MNTTTLKSSPHFTQQQPHSPKLSHTKLKELPQLDMAMVSTYCPQFSGLRRSCPKLDNSQSQSFVQHINSQLRLASSGKPCRAVTAMAGSGKVPFSIFFRSIANVFKTLEITHRSRGGSKGQLSYVIVRSKLIFNLNIYINNYIIFNSNINFC